MNKKMTPLAVATALTCLVISAHAQTDTAADGKKAEALDAVVINASADASRDGLIKPFAGGQVARGGRAGILGTKDNLDTPFSITAYTNELIQDRQAKSVADVLQNDPGVRVARGFGDFQEAYFIRGFLLSSDDVAYNGLYSLLPRQYIATELFERVELLRGASSFLLGASPGSDGIGGTINLVPKRAANLDLNRITLSTASGGQTEISADVSRRFGPDKASGIRVNAAYSDGGTAVHEEHAKLGLLDVALDWHSRDVRLSADLGYQDNQLQRTRTNIALQGLTAIPALPAADANFAQPWSYSNERDTFGTLRGEYDITSDVTAWAAYGLRRSSEANSLANLTVTSLNGDGNTSRFDNTRKDAVDTGEAGMRGKFSTGSVGHEWVVSASYFQLDKKTAYEWDYFNQQNTNLYAPTYLAQQPAFSSGAFVGGTLADPGLTGVTRLSSVALGDTLSMLDSKLLLTLGLRDQKLHVEGFGYQLAAPYDKSRLSPVAGAVYKASKQLSFYGNYIEGLSQGDTVAPANGQPGFQLAPYISKQKEVGVKFDAGRLGLDAALFTTDKPRAVQSQDTAQGFDRHSGLELTVFGLATRDLKVLGGLTLLDTTQHDTGVAATEGKRTLGAAKTLANLGVEWEVTGVDGLALDARAVYTGGVYADSANTLAVPSWTRLDIGARYNFEIQRTLMTARLRVDNAANRSYWASAGGYPEQGYLVVGAPRTVKLSLSADF